jgi:hypothetical protein
MSLRRKQKRNKNCVASKVLFDYFRKWDKIKVVIPDWVIFCNCNIFGDKIEKSINSSWIFWFLILKGRKMTCFKRCYFCCYLILTWKIPFPSWKIISWHELVGILSSLWRYLLSLYTSLFVCSYYFNQIMVNWSSTF